MNGRVSAIFLAIAYGIGHCQSTLKVRAVDGSTFEAIAVINAGSSDRRVGATLCLTVESKRLCHTMPSRRFLAMGLNQRCTH